MCQVKNWPPISVLNTVNKILTKIYASRLQTILTKIISPDEVGYIKGRYIGDIVCTIRDLIDFSSCSNLPELLTLLDLEKAFDSISWLFLFKYLKSFNFGDNFVAVVRMLCNNIESCVIKQWKASEFCKLYRGIRQGSCLNAMLFLLVVEVLAIDHRCNKNIKGITKDDTTLFLQDEPSLKLVFNRLDIFGQCSGLKLNKYETEINTLGGKVNWCNKISSNLLFLQ